MYLRLVKVASQVTEEGPGRPCRFRIREAVDESWRTIEFLFCSQDGFYWAKVWRRASAIVAPGAPEPPRQRRHPHKPLS
jgi:hypothetical protein